MIRKRGKVEPGNLHQYRTIHTNSNDDYPWSSSDDDSIGFFEFAFRRGRNSKISRLCTSEEMQAIEKRFDDTAFVIYKVSISTITIKQ